ncbi:MAG: D,D-heptose 1,7-bisphosphate phosphatase [Candidatus Aenigmatarchaeota archaeon]|nr:MAG: D,D-heptose 1,7-bisphosphate phosphatase [Candidatus Aenigmarchaeota archaeon]
MRPAVFIDRDGTINEQRGYINHISQFVLLPGVGKAISLLNKNNHTVVLTSNQSGVARGYFPIQLVKEIHELMAQNLAKDNAYIDRIYFCPHHPDGVVPEYSRKCDCRKPNTGFIKKAKAELDIEMETSYVIGDRLLDIEFAHNANLPGILVLTGYGKGELKYSMPHKSITPVYVAKDLLSAVKWILEQE